MNAGGEKMEPGWIWCEDGAIVGIAADGVIVQLGDIDHCDSLLSYLAAHPTPEDW